jgi:hypothetical protein
MESRRMRPCRTYLRIYARAVRVLLAALTRIDDWLLERRYPQ